MKNKISLAIKLFVLLLAVHIIYPYPYQFRRLVITKDSQIIKTIDLISDYHVRIEDIVKNPSRTRKKLLSPTEREMFTTSERTLLITLRKLAQQPPVKELLWEQPRIIGKFRANLSLPVSDLFDFFDFNAENKWIFFGFLFRKEFAPQKNLMLVYKNANTYRDFYFDLELLSESSENFLKQLRLSRFPIQYFFKKFNDVETRVDRDLNEVKKYQFTNYYQQLQLLWATYRDKYISPVYDFLKKIIDSNPIISTIEDLRTTIIQKNLAEYKTLMQEWIYFIPDIEFLIKLFASPHKHTILYCGGFHTANVSDLLQKHFGAQEIVQIGIHYGLDFALFSPYLIAKSWVYLEEDPAKSFARFKARGIRRNLVSNELWQEYITLHSLFKLAAEAKAYPGEPLRFDSQLIKETNSFYKKAFKTYIDFINLQDASGKTLLFYATEAGLPTIITYLLDHGAHRDIKDKAGKKAVDYASSYTIADLFIQKSAKKEAIAPIQEMSKKAIEQALKETEEKKQKAHKEFAEVGASEQEAIKKRQDQLGYEKAQGAYSQVDLQNSLDILLKKLQTLFEFLQ